jgi:KDO2-lipid IV(A) lauroyltransferase
LLAGSERNEEKMKKLRYFLEYLVLKIALFFFGKLDVDRASNAGGIIGRFLGPLLPHNREALRNLQMALPDLPEGKRKLVISRMWDNLGRILGEYPHLEKIGRERTEIIGRHVLDLLLGSEKCAVLIAAHLANWEMGPQALKANGLDIYPVVRMPNNPWTRNIISKQRNTREIPKSSKGARQMVNCLKQNRRIAILIDQKYNEGETIPFFGKPAMTSPAFVQLAKKYDCPLIPMRLERIQGANFRLTFYEPLELKDHKDRPLPDEQCILKAHKILEEWISERPEQWIWLHRRWKSKSPELPSV